MAAVRSTADAVRNPLGTAASGNPSSTPSTPSTPGATAPVSAYAMTQVPDAASVDHVSVEREREYPREGADSYGALPDTALVYAGSLPASPLAEDALYTRGEAA